MILQRTALKEKKGDMYCDHGTSKYHEGTTCHDRILVKACTISIFHASTVNISDAWTMKMAIHACTMIAVRTCTMLTVRAFTMIRTHAYTMIIRPACDCAHTTFMYYDHTTCIRPLCLIFDELEGGGSGGRSGGRLGAASRPMLNNIASSYKSSCNQTQRQDDSAKKQDIILSS